MTAFERKQQTEKKLTLWNIPFIDHLPAIEDEDETTLRTPQQIAERILILTYLCYVGEVVKEKKEVVSFLKSEKLWESTSDNEKALFQKKKFSPRNKIDISWRTEAIWLLLWTIKKIEIKEIPVEPSKVDDILEQLPDLMTETNDFIATAEIRSISEILDLSDLIYRLHWAARQANLDNKEIPIINSSVIEERHYAINWLTFYADNWDDVTTDT
jgi:Domain of unknown function (DUF4272)